MIKASGLDLLAEKELEVGTLLDLNFGSQEHPSLLVIGGENEVVVWDIAEIPHLQAFFN